MWRLLNSRELCLPFGMSVVKTRFVPCGDTISKTHKVYIDYQSSFERLFTIIIIILLLGIIFVVDSNDRDRIEDAREELMRMMNEDELRDAVLLVFANKQDLPNAMSVADIIAKMSLSSLTSTKWHVEATCATTGEGLYEGLTWLSDTLQNKGR